MRVATLNIAGMAKAWFSGRADKLCDGLRALGPDVLALQETGVRGGPGFHDQAAFIGKCVGLPVRIFVPYGNPEEVDSDEQGGVALLSRWPVLTFEERRLTPGLYPPDNRTALLVELGTPEGSLHVVTAHLSWRPEEAGVRRDQVSEMLARARDHGWLPGMTRAEQSRFVLLGDLNALEHEPAIDMLEHQLVDAFRHHNPEDPGVTWARSNPYSGGYPSPDRRLDYIFVDAMARIAASGRALHEPATIASDHFAVWADVVWPHAS